MSNDVAVVLAVARQERPLTEARDIIKDPMVLEFLGLADNQTIGASKYQLYLSSEQALLAEVGKEIDKLDHS